MEKYPKDSKVMNAWNKITYDDNVEGGREGGVLSLKNGCLKKTMSRKQWKLVVRRERNDSNNYFENPEVFVNLKRRIRSAGLKFHFIPETEISTVIRA